MTAENLQTIVALFTDAADASRAIHDLRELGIHEHQLGVIGRDNGTNSGAQTASSDSYAQEGGIAGAAAGAGIGVLVGITVTSGVIPALGPAIAAGTLASVFASTIAGAAAAGLAGSLLGLGISREEAAFYESKLASGMTVVTVDATSQRDDVMHVFEVNHAWDTAADMASGLHHPSA